MVQQMDFNLDFNGEDMPVKYATEKHVACVFCLDISGSMEHNDAIGQLNEGLKMFKQQTLSSLDTHAKACIDVAIVTFNDNVDMIQNFAPVEDMIVPTLTASGRTAMGGALEMAMDMITQQKERYNYAGTPYFRPWIFCITDGGPNDEYLDAAERLRWMEENKKVVAYCVGVEGFRADIMKDIFKPQNIYGLRNCDFTGLFKFVSSSLDALRNSTAETGSLNVEVPETMFQVPLD